MSLLNPPTESIAKPYIDSPDAALLLTQPHGIQIAIYQRRFGVRQSGNAACFFEVAMTKASAISKRLNVCIVRLRIAQPSVFAASQFLTLAKLINQGWLINT
jgi:hypothetical protein